VDVTLWRNTTQTVFGAGPARAELMFVGEQSGDREDRQGEPFVGPAGGLLDRALTEVGIGRDVVYLTNAVKHFKWRPRGKRRLHQTPRAGEVVACRPWLEAEVEAIAPQAVIALGATAAKTLFGSSVRVTRDRGRLLDTSLAPIGMVTVHPSAILRVRESEERHDAFAGLVEDLTAVSPLSRRGVVGR
jgi:uracil-DNA glycosylase